VTKTDYENIGKHLIDEYKRAVYSMVETCFSQHMAEEMIDAYSNGVRDGMKALLTAITPSKD
jgi:hypothetical protein